MKYYYIDVNLANVYYSRWLTKWHILTRVEWIWNITNTTIPFTCTHLTICCYLYSILMTYARGSLVRVTTSVESTTSSTHSSTPSSTHSSTLSSTPNTFVHIFVHIFVNTPPPHSSTLLYTPPHSSTLIQTPPHSSTLLYTPPHSTLPPPSSSSYNDVEFSQLICNASIIFSA